MSKPPHKSVLTIAGVLVAWRWIWPALEAMDVLDGAGSLLATLVPFLRAHWGDALSLAGVALIVYEAGRSGEWWGRLRRRLRTPEVAEASVAQSTPQPPPVPPEPPAVPETAERLIDLFKRWDETLAFATFVLEREVCAHGTSEKDQLLCYAIRAFPMEISKGKLIELRRKFEYFKPREATQSAFTTLRSELGDTLRECNFLLVNWINKGGAVIRGEQLLSVPVYTGFCESYKEALEAARSLRFHTELGGLANALLELETKPKPPVDPPPSKASEPDQQP